MTKKAKLAKTDKLAADISDLWIDIVSLWLKDPSAWDWITRLNSAIICPTQPHDDPHGRKTEKNKKKSTSKKRPGSVMAASKHGDALLSKLAADMAASFGGENAIAKSDDKTRRKNRARWSTS